jgi:hypothetical protein
MCAGTTYKDKPPGNSPESARGLGSFGFADLGYAMCFNYALAWHCPYGEPRRIFGLGTPKEVWYLVEQTWTVVGAPSNARVTEENSGWEWVCDKIIEAKGCIVPVHPALVGAYECLLEPEGGGAAAEGP